MQTRLLFVLSAAVALNLSTGCKNASSSNQSTESAEKNGADTTRSAGLEKKDPNTKYKPAFEGQTRIATIAKTTTAYKVDTLAQKLGSVWSIEVMPDGRLLVTERSGYMQILTAEGGLVKKITGLPKVHFSGQGGLLDVALDPDFANNKMIYWSFSEGDKKSNLTAVAKGKLNEASGTVDNAVVIFRATPKLEGSDLHYGSRIVFDKDGNL
ncbi:MAG: PQQ-dependent sugar dehydrogenase, partial [Chitinophagaceae bacterium]